jgi:hypothetical protein
MKDILAEAGIAATKENKKEIDKIIHKLVAVEYKNCSPTWKAVKEQIKSDENTKRRFVKKLRDGLKGIK